MGDFYYTQSVSVFFAFYIELYVRLEAQCMKFVHGGAGRVSLSSACTLSNLRHLKGCLTACLGPIPLRIQDCWLPIAHLLACLIAPNCFCLLA